MTKTERGMDAKRTTLTWNGNNLKEIIDTIGKHPLFDKWFKTWEEYESYVHEHNNIVKYFVERGHYEIYVGCKLFFSPVIEQWIPIGGKYRYIESVESVSEDLEKEIDAYFAEWSEDSEYGSACKPDCYSAGLADCKDIARHFAEWGVSHVKKSDISQPVTETCKENGNSLTDEELEKFRTEYVDKEIERIYPDLSPHLSRKSKLSLNVFNGGDLETAIDNAVRWQKEQMMKDAIEGGCFSYKNGYVHISCDIDEHLTDIKMGDKVKVIIIKE